MPAIKGGDLDEHRTYDPQTSAFIFNGTPLVDVEQMSHSADKGHGLNNTVDNNAVTVLNVPRVEATAAVHATSESINGVKALFAGDEVFDATFVPSDDSGLSPVTLMYCVIQDVDYSTVEIDGMPTFEVTLEGYDMT